VYSSKILLVDDQRSHLNTLKKMFEHFGCEVVTVDSGEEAEFVLDWASDFDAIVTDLKMPWLDGVEFCADTKKKFPQLQI
jgi:two-component system response regulator YesN